jgi:hypothetical protein
MMDEDSSIIFKDQLKKLNTRDRDALTHLALEYLSRSIFTEMYVRDKGTRTRHCCTTDTDTDNRAVCGAVCVVEWNNNGG